MAQKQVQKKGNKKLEEVKKEIVLENPELATGSGASEHQASTDESSHKLDSNSMLLLVKEQQENFGEQ